MLDRSSRYSSTIFSLAGATLALTLMLSGCATLTKGGAGIDGKKIARYLDNVHHANRLEVVMNEAGLLKKNRIKFAETPELILIYGQVTDKEDIPLVNKLTQQEARGKKIFNCLETRPPLSYAQVLSDGWITAKIKSKFLLESKYNLKDVRIITDDQIVYLLGNVSKKDAFGAVEVARSVNGVWKITKVFS